MAVSAKPFPGLQAIAGVRLGTTCAGIKKIDRKDLVVVEIQRGSEVAAVFTKNAFCAAPVQLARLHLGRSAPAYLLVNTGNANAGTGQPGFEDALYCCQCVADATGVDVSSVLPFSTGVIGEPLPVAVLTAGIGPALAALSESGWRDAAEAILTTDTRAKGATACFEYKGQSVRINGIAKGAGMIRPDMATMLSFVATDARIAQPVLQRLLADAVDASFNRITVDGDTSTNDACVLIATGAADVPEIASAESDLYALFSTALQQVCCELAQLIIRDGEGATKFVSVCVEQGSSSDECLATAYAIAHSPLVKTALFACDPNWGRILAVVGRAGIKDLEVEKVLIYLNTVCIVEQGALAPSYTEAQGQAVMQGEEIVIRVLLGRGDCNEAVWTTDLSHDYVSINADYRT